jgi:hypothetical protein
VNRCLTGFATLGSGGEMANVSQVLQPGARGAPEALGITIINGGNPL